MVRIAYTTHSVATENTYQDQLIQKARQQAAHQVTSSAASAAATVQKKVASVGLVLPAPIQSALNTVVDTTTSLAQDSKADLSTASHVLGSAAQDIRNNVTKIPAVLGSDTKTAVLDVADAAETAGQKVAAVATMAGADVVKGAKYVSTGAEKAALSDLTSAEKGLSAIGSDILGGLEKYVLPALILGILLYVGVKHYEKD